MTNHASGLNKLEQAIGPAQEPMHMLRVIIDPAAPRCWRAAMWWMAQ